MEHYNIRVFGSVARGEATVDSDVDFLVELTPESTLLDYIALIQDWEALLVGRRGSMISHSRSLRLLA